MSSCQTAWACHLTWKYLCLAQLTCRSMFNPERWVHLSLRQLVITHPLVRRNLEEPDSAPWRGREPLRAKLAFKPVQVVTNHLQNIMNNNMYSIKTEPSCTSSYCVLSYAGQRHTQLLYLACPAPYFIHSKSITSSFKVKELGHEARWVHLAASTPSITFSQEGGS